MALMATAFDVEGHLEWIVSKDQENVSLYLPKYLHCLLNLLIEFLDTILLSIYFGDCC